MKMNKKEKLDLIWASSHFLTDDLPLNFSDWSDKKLNNYLINKAWAPFENMSAQDIFENIENLAKSMRGYIKNERI